MRHSITPALPEATGRYDDFNTGRAGRARLAQGRILGAASLLGPALTLDADASILVEDGLQTSAIEGERLDLDAVRSSVARHLGLPTGDLPAALVR